MALQSQTKRFSTVRIQNWGEKLIDFILPPLCPVTGEMVDKIGMVSPTLWRDLSFIHAPYCDHCGAPFPFDADTVLCGQCIDHPPLYTKGRSALIYDDHSRDMILRFKHGDQLHAVKAFTPWLKQIGSEVITQADIIIPVPLHRNRLIKRRYNQADIIARDLLRGTNKAYMPDLLQRVKNTQSQGHKKAKDRVTNIARAFAVHPKYEWQIQGKNILIIDDVYTTGATLNECTKTLQASRANDIYTLTLARAVKD